MREGKVPYRDFRVEYPPLALPLFLAAALASHDVAGFKVAFAVEMLIFNAATVWLVAAWVERTQGRDRVRIRLARYTVLYLPALAAHRLAIRRGDDVSSDSPPPSGGSPDAANGAASPPHSAR